MSRVGHCEWRCAPCPLTLSSVPSSAIASWPWRGSQVKFKNSTSLSRSVLHTNSYQAFMTSCHSHSHIMSSGQPLWAWLRVGSPSVSLSSQPSSWATPGLLQFLPRRISTDESLSFCGLKPRDPWETPDMINTIRFRTASFEPNLIFGAWKSWVDTPKLKSHRCAELPTHPWLIRSRSQITIIVPAALGTHVLPGNHTHLAREADALEEVRKST